LRKGNLRNQTGVIFGNTFMMAQRLEKMAEKLAVPRLACALRPLHCQRLNVTPDRELFICPARPAKKPCFDREVHSLREVTVVVASLRRSPLND
jgi:hypothetical protein